MDPTGAWWHETDGQECCAPELAGEIAPLIVGGSAADGTYDAVVA